MQAELDALWDFNDPAGTEARFREFLAKAESNQQAEILTQLARSIGLQRRFDEAHEVLDEAAAAIESGSRAEVRYMLERGRVLNSSGAPHSAITFFLQALDAANACGDEYLAVDAAHMMGIADEPKSRLKWNLKAIDMAERATDPKARKWLASLYNNTGWTLFDEGRFEEALALFVKARALRAEWGQDLQEKVARWCIARVYRAMDRNDEALDVQLELLAEGHDDGFVHEELAELYAARNVEHAASDHARKARKVLANDPWFVENEPERMARLVRLAAESESN